jgi:FtsH-binding integral membrane protein
MDRIRQFADHSVRRAAGLGLLGIALVVVALHADRALAMHALAFLLTLEAATLYGLGLRAGRVPYRGRELFVPMDSQAENRARRHLGEVMRETYMAYARRLIGPAIAAWVVDLGLRL